jgi:hypothetical protein
VNVVLDELPEVTEGREALESNHAWFQELEVLFRKVAV